MAQTVRKNTPWSLCALLRPDAWGIRISTTWWPVLPSAPQRARRETLPVLPSGDSMGIQWWFNGIQWWFNGIYDGLPSGKSIYNFYGKIHHFLAGYLKKKTISKYGTLKWGVHQKVVTVTYESSGWVMILMDSSANLWLYFGPGES